MKKSILVFFFLLLLSHTVLSQIESHYPKYDSLSKTYKIANIKEIKKAYLISVIDRDNYKFTIVSPKIKDKEKGKEKIKLGDHIAFRNPKSFRLKILPSSFYLCTITSGSR